MKKKGVELQSKINSGVYPRINNNFLGDKMKKKWILFILLFLFTGCSNLNSHSNSKVYTKKELEGKATWYGKKFHGKKTASGENYDMFKMTAAHRTIDFGTKVKVTEKNTGKSVEVYINDRGPLMDNVVIDLSYAAFKELGDPKKGFIDVTLEVIK